MGTQSFTQGFYVIKIREQLTEAVQLGGGPLLPLELTSSSGTGNSCFTETH